MKPTLVQPQLQWILLLQDRSPPAHRKSLRGVQAVNRDADSIYGHRLLVGSAPPSCQGKCGSCNPCNPIHVSVGSPHGTLTQQEYYPEVWRCKCGNRLFMPWNVQGTYSCKATSTVLRATSNDISRRNLLTLRKHSSSRCKGGLLLLDRAGHWKLARTLRNTTALIDQREFRGCNDSEVIIRMGSEREIAQVCTHLVTMTQSVWKT